MFRYTTHYYTLSPSAMVGHLYCTIQEMDILVFNKKNVYVHYQQLHFGSTSKIYFHSSSRKSYSFKNFMLIQEIDIHLTKPHYSFRNSSFLTLALIFIQKSSSRTSSTNTFNKLTHPYPSWFEILTHHSPRPFMPEGRTGNSQWTVDLEFFRGYSKPVKHLWGGAK